MIKLLVDDDLKRATLALVPFSQSNVQGFEERDQNPEHDFGGMQDKGDYNREWDKSHEDRNELRDIIQQLGNFADALKRPYE
jgi:hypothetical protein